MQMVARHAYALTFEREQVEKWEAEFSEGMWGGKGLGEDEGDEMREALRPRSARHSPAQNTLTAVRPMTSFAWAFWQELVQIATMSG
jgi:RNA-dependent RNA polymerase